MMDVTITEQQLQAIDAMAKQLRSNRATVINTAMALLQIALRVRREGNRVCIIRTGPLLKEIIGF